MSEYLDKTGLSYLWGKIKGKLNNKADKSSLDTVSNKVDDLGNARIRKTQQRIYANDKGIATIPAVTGYIPVAVLGSDNTGIHSNSDGTYETRFLYADNSGNITINANMWYIVDVIYEKF